MEVAVEGGAVTPLRHYGDLGQGCPPHEEEHVGMTGFPMGGGRGLGRGSALAL